MPEIRVQSWINARILYFEGMMYNYLPSFTLPIGRLKLHNLPSLPPPNVAVCQSELNLKNNYDNRKKKI